jgi:hypothetical protein
MPGGSGLLNQVCQRFPEIIEEAIRLAENCPSRCASSCIDCFQRYRNAFYHKHLDRHIISEKLRLWGPALSPTHSIPPRQPEGDQPREEQPVNLAERRLKDMLQRAGFPEGQWQKQIILPNRTLRSTTPDVTFEDPDESERKIYIYLDGLSGHLHGNPDTIYKDLQIRQQLRAADHDVLEISAHDLGDRNMMTRHFKRLARLLQGRAAMNQVAEGADEWFVENNDDELIEAQTQNHET